MADRKISDLTALTTPASGDYLPIVDISEAAAASKNKRITIEELMRGVPDGTAAAPSIAFETDPNTGIYRAGTDSLAVATNGVGRLFVDANGNTTIRSDSTSITTPITLQNRGIDGAGDGVGISFNMAYLDGTVRNSGAIYSIAENNHSTVGTSVTSLVFSPSAANVNTERLRITSAGLVGIGTSSPSGMLDVSGSSFVRFSNSTAPTLSNDTHAGEALFIRSGGSAGDGNVQAVLALGKADGASVRSGAAIGSVQTTADVDQVGLAFYTSGSTASSQTLSERVRITHAGNVGIGTTPVVDLDVAPAASTATFRIHARSNTTPVAAIELMRGANTTWGNDGYGDYRIKNDGGNLIFEYGDTTIGNLERARIDSSGRLLIGTSSAFNSGSTIEAAGSSGGVVTLTNTNTDITGANSVFGQINFYTADTSGGNTGIFAKITAESNGNFDGNGSRGMDLKFFTGNVTIGANTPTERLRITSAGVLQVAEAGNIAVGTTTGTKIGTATTQKLGFYNATPVVQPTAVADATDAATVITQLNALLAKLRTLGIIAT
jgi:hypothetical protein